MKHSLIADVISYNRLGKFSSKQFAFCTNCNRANVQPSLPANCVRELFLYILFTGLLCDNSNSLTYEPRKGQSPTLSRANCVILHRMLAFHSNNSNLNL